MNNKKQFPIFYYSIAMFHESCPMHTCHNMMNIHKLLAWWGAVIFYGLVGVTPRVY